MAGPAGEAFHGRVAARFAVWLLRGLCLGVSVAWVPAEVVALLRLGFLLLLFELVVVVELIVLLLRQAERQGGCWVDEAGRDSPLLLMVLRLERGERKGEVACWLCCARAEQARVWVGKKGVMVLLLRLVS